MELIINDRIRQRKVDKFNSVKVVLRYNSIASPFSFDFFYDPDIIETKELACIGHYHICKLYHNGELMLTGQMLSEAFTNSSVRQLVAIGGYSLPGILEDSHIPTNDAIDEAMASVTKVGNQPKSINLKVKPGDPKPYCYPLQADGLTLREIATKLLAPFGIRMVVDDSVKAEMDDPFSETSADAKDTVKHYLTELATQKNINITHDRYGNVVFTKVNTNVKPIFFFDVPRGGLPGTKMAMHFNGQQMHSQITVMQQADADVDNAGESTVTNPYVPFIFRPKTIIQSSGTNIDTELAAKNALAAELKNMTITVTIDRWAINNKLIFPGQLISVKNPEIYIFNKTDFLIESIEFSADQKEETAVMTCVLPEVYNNNTPQYIFRGINLH